jgi:hypothetical protein
VCRALLVPAPPAAAAGRYLPDSVPPMSTPYASSPMLKLLGAHASARSPSNVRRKGLKSFCGCGGGARRPVPHGVGAGGRHTPQARGEQSVAVVARDASPSPHTHTHAHTPRRTHAQTRAHLDRHGQRHAQPLGSLAHLAHAKRRLIGDAPGLDLAGLDELAHCRHLCCARVCVLRLRGDCARVCVSRC